MLKETPGSLRAYFGLISIFAFLPVVGMASSGTVNIGSAIVSVIFGGLYAFVAIRMDYLLAQRPGIIRGVLILNLVLSGLSAVSAILGGRGYSGLPVVLIAFAITAYLLSSVGRLSREAAAVLPPGKGSA